jgi:hypothetical protein
MSRRRSSFGDEEVRGQNEEPNSLREVARETAKLWRKHHLSYDQSKHVVEQTLRPWVQPWPSYALKWNRRRLGRLTRFSRKR